MVLLVSLLGQILVPFFGITNIAMLYLLPVLIAAVRWGRGASFLASFLGVLIFDYLFVPPVFALTPRDPRDYFILAVFLLVSVVTGTMATRLRNETERLRALASRIESIREEDRTAVAREIHDELGQTLTGLKLDLARLSRKLPQNETTLTAHIGSMMEIVDNTIAVVRRISTELRPGILDELGLTCAIEWQVEDFRRRTDIECDFLSTLDDTNLDRKLSTAVFRILQEALTNVVRHAHATYVKIDIEEESGFVTMTVEDNGKGIAEHEVHDPKSLGLLGIRERALILGGEAYIGSKKGKGASLTIRIPIRRVEGTCSES